MKKALCIVGLVVLLVGFFGTGKTDYFDNLYVVTGTFAETITIGGGYGSTGISVSAAGVIQANGAITSDGAVTGGSLTDGTVSIASGSVTGTWADLGTISTCDIDGGTIDGITDLAVADGGTGASTASAARTSLGVVIGTNVQAWDTQLDDIAALVQSDSYFIVGDGSNWVEETGATVRTSLGLTIGTNVQAYDAELAALAGLTSAANAIPYFTGSGTAGTISSSANMVSLLGSADYATARTNFGVAIGSDVEAYDAGLANLASLTMAADEFYYTSADNTHQTASVTSFGRSILDDGDEATFKATVNLEADTDFNAYDADLTTYAGITPTSHAQTALGNANNSVVLCHRHRVTIAEINGGHELLPAISGKSYRLVSCKAIAYGGAAGAVTTVDLLGTQSASGVKLVAFAQASLTQSAVLFDGGTGAAVLADGASYQACDANSAITVGKTGSDVTTATGVDFIVEYVIE